MKRTIAGLITVIGLVFCSLNVNADTLVGPGGAFQPWTSAILGPANAPTYGSPYWNNFSGDGPAANIGWCLSGGGGCSIPGAPGALPFYGSGMNAVQNMSFTSSGVPVTVSLLGAFTNQTVTGNGVDYFGWYVINQDGTIGAMTTLMSSATARVGAGAVFTPSAQYGFFLENVQGNGAADYFWFMNSTADFSAGPQQNPVDGIQHFSVFNGVPGVFFLGVEDTNRGDEDFNDMVFVVSSVPEPQAGLLGCAGLLLSGAWFRGSRKAKTA